ncbi:uncharacterized protein N7459_002985 [Penicillium hispanicum]|uniref:uncharacterized protein n=1 Tax=Penicillium hispanicum TaxID=1080232 RepID=UPI0025420F04|nr:uncharacterized protein N7459_002985 [Penicillium hispanicum]KAJ5587220.1 hypothetical protein N7459_002985 [Penicillium hispanicum]
MNLTTRSQSKSQSPKTDPTTSTPKSQKSNSPRPSNATRKRTSELAETKAKRVRTGCLTCRERHLKCDEALGRCLNCRKSDRICRRGVRLNFIDIQTVAPPRVIARPKGAKVTFRDDSRFIASEYVGGFERYPPPRPESPVEERIQSPLETFDANGSDYLANMFQSVANSFDPLAFEISHSAAADFLLGPDTWHEPHLVPGDELLPHGTSDFARKLGAKQYGSSPLSDPEQAFLLQVFVEEVGPGMDALDSTKHFTHILPLYALEEPMLLNAFLACGARHLSLIDPTYGEEKTAHYYDASTQDLMNAIHDPYRDSVLCATTALTLSYYEMMPPQPESKVNHIPGSRALIHECGWTAKTPGLGGACFWVSVGMELLGCLQHRWSLSWNPDAWGVDMDMDQVHPFWKTDEIWLHRIIYVCAKVANLRVKLQQMHSVDDPATQNPPPSDSLPEWNQYKSWCDQWFGTIPQSMKPVGHVQPWQTDSSSSFPNIWLIKPLAVIAQLFYHTTCILLANAHPIDLQHNPEMRKWQQTHVYDMCGLAANIKDRSLVRLSIRCVIIAAEYLETRESQEELLSILNSLVQGTAWHVEPIKDELTRLWGWPVPHHETVDPAQMHNHLYDLDPTLSVHKTSAFSDLVNPLTDTGDFSMQNHPYQGYYVAPHHYHYGSYLV